MANFYEVRTFEKDQSIFLNPDLIADFQLTDESAYHKGVLLCREDFVSMLIASSTNVQTITRDPTETTAVSGVVGGE